MHHHRTPIEDAPFKRSNLALGWRLGASLEIDIVATADGRFVVVHDPTLGPSTTGRGHVARMRLAATRGFLHRDRHGAPDPDAPVLSLADFVAPLRTLPRAPTASLQLDLKIIEGHKLSGSAVADAARAMAGLERSVVIGSHFLDEARRLAAAIPGTRLGYDPMLAASRRPALARDPERLLRHIEKRTAGVTFAYLGYAAVFTAERRGFPLVRRLLELGIETDVWTINPGRDTTDVLLRTLIQAGVGQITTDAPREISRQIRSL
jgi:glycerophosphoryl diester phosphodiesterase